MPEQIKIKNESELFDLVIVGGGPAGCTAGITSARKGLKVVILEKGNILAPKLRGETIHHYPLLDEILGTGFIQSISKHDTPIRIYHSPKDKFQTKITVKSTSYVFDWRELINQFIKILKDLNVSIKLNCEVLEPIIRANICIGVKYREKEGKIKEIYGKLIMGCDGHESALGRYYGINYEKINNPITKCLLSNANIDIRQQPGLQLFLMANGDLPDFPDFPPCAGFIFPRGGKDVEVGIMLFMRAVLKMNDLKIPNNTEIMAAWNLIKETYPGFSEVFKGAKIEHEVLTGITSAGFEENFIPHPGIILIGDSVGFVESTGSSGLYSSMEMANQMINIIADKINEPNLWDQENIKKFKRLFKKTAIYKHITKTYKLTDGFFNQIFVELRKAEKINEKWEFFIELLKKARS